MMMCDMVGIQKLLKKQFKRTLKFIGMCVSIQLLHAKKHVVKYGNSGCGHRDSYFSYILLVPSNS